MLDLNGLNLEEAQAKIAAFVATVEQIRKTINDYIKAALAAGTGADAIAFMADIAKAVATGGHDPAVILQTLQQLVTINNDLTAAAAAVKAQPLPTP